MTTALAILEQAASSPWYVDDAIAGGVYVGNGQVGFPCTATLPRPMADEIAAAIVLAVNAFAVTAVQRAVCDLWREIASAAPLALYVASMPWQLEDDHGDGRFAGGDATPTELESLRCMLAVAVCSDCAVDVYE